MSDELVNLGEFGSLMQAEQICSLLEANHIRAVIPDGNASSIMPHMIIALGGVRILVLQSDLTKALEILQKFSQKDFEKPKLENNPELDDVQGQAPSNPLEALALRASMAAVLGCFMVPVLLNLYSIRLMVQGLGSQNSGAVTTAKFQRRMRTALVFNIVGLAFWTVVGIHYLHNLRR